MCGISLWRVLRPLHHDWYSDTVALGLILTMILVFLGHELNAALAGKRKGQMRFGASNSQKDARTAQPWWAVRGLVMGLVEIRSHFQLFTFHCRGFFQYTFWEPNCGS
jgi:hypothetical protein